MSFESLVLQNRSYRAFDKGAPISKEVMLSLVDLARQAGSGMNKQPLCYRILSSAEEIKTMLGNCRFATKLGLSLPPVGKEPTGFILIFIDREVGSPLSLALKDAGIAAQTILLAAVEQGFGGCMLGSFDPQTLLADFRISDRYEPVLAIALGKPAEQVSLVSPRDGSLDYYRDEQGVHCVPKRTLDDILI